MLTVLYNTINQYVVNIAIGANSFKNINGKIIKKLYFTDSKNNFTLKSRGDVEHQ